VFETPARTSLPSPRVTSPLLSFTTPRTESLGQEDHYLHVISEQISSAIAFDPEVPGPEATQAPTSAPDDPSGCRCIMSVHFLGFLVQRLYWSL
jgi:hypothetical protein